MSETADEPGHHCPSDWPAPLRLLATISRALAALEGAAIVLFLLAVVVLSTWQCVERNLVQHHIPFFHAPAWADGVVRHSVFVLGFVGGAYAAFCGRHIRIDAVTRLVSVRKRLALRVITTIGVLVVLVILVSAGNEAHKLMMEENNDAAQADQFFTSARGVMILIIGYGVIAFHFVVQMLLDIGWLLSKREPPASYVAEASAH